MKVIVFFKLNLCYHLKYLFLKCYFLNVLKVKNRKLLLLQSNLSYFVDLYLRSESQNNVFFSPVREMICPIKSHSWVSCQNSLWHWHTCFRIINPTRLLHQLVQFLTRQQFMHKYCRCTLSIKFTIFVTSFSSNITISSIKDLILL